jgi:hypothetical protein
VTPARCPACGAAVATGAPWCTLCYTDLRPAPAEPVAVTAVATTAATTTAATAVPPVSGGRHRAPRHADRTGPSGPMLPATPVDLLDPALDRPVLTHSDAVRAPATWPCLTCGDLVPIAEAACTHCGAAFLSAGRLEPRLSLPGIGDPRWLSTGAKAAIVAGGAAALMLLLLVFAAVVGHFL